MSGNAPNAPNALIGGKYDLVRQLGTGVLGSVWEAEEPANGGRVALKLMSCPTDDLCGRILDEARIAKDVVYPSLVKILDVGEAREREPFVAMELCQGETLRDRLAREKKLPPRLAAEIGRDVAGALTTAHSARLVHGDLRPGNVFLVGEPGTPEPIVKILDLWLARSLGPEHAELLDFEAPFYKSPEQIASRQPPDVRSDLWALGVLLFEMTTGKSPFGDAKKRQDIEEAVMRGPIARLTSLAPDVDPALEEIITRCLERERDKRIGSAMVVTHMLNAIATPPVKKAQPETSRSVSSSAMKGQLLSSATEVYAGPAITAAASAPSARGQLGTLVMSPDDPLPSSGPVSPAAETPSQPSAGPLGTMVMGGSDSASAIALPAPRTESSLSSQNMRGAIQSPRDQLATQVFAESFSTTAPMMPTTQPQNAYAPHAPQAPGPTTPGLSTLMSARAPQPTATDMPSAMNPGPTEAQRILMIVLAVGVVLLVGLVVLFLVL